MGMIWAVRERARSGQPSTNRLGHLGHAQWQKLLGETPHCPAPKSSDSARAHTMLHNLPPTTTTLGDKHMFIQLLRRMTESTCASPVPIMPDNPQPARADATPAQPHKRKHGMDKAHALFPFRSHAVYKRPNSTHGQDRRGTCPSILTGGAFRRT